MSSKETLLAEVQFFQLLDPEERAALAEVLEESHHEAGAILFDVGDPGDRMYVVGAGAVELSATDKLGQKIVLTLCERGDMFGELSLPTWARARPAPVTEVRNCWRSTATSCATSSVAS
jgi:CRP-like cAMP-binding protein